MSETDDFEFEDRAENVLPTFTYWGTGIVLIKKEQWYKSRDRIKAILKQLHREKVRRLAQKGKQDERSN